VLASFFTGTSSCTVAPAPTPRSGRAIAPGARVALHGLQNAAALNDKSGAVEGWDAEHERWVVRIDGDPNPRALRAANLTVTRAPPPPLRTPRSGRQTSGHQAAPFFEPHGAPTPRSARRSGTPSSHDNNEGAPLSTRTPRGSRTPRGARSAAAAPTTATADATAVIGGHGSESTEAPEPWIEQYERQREASAKNACTPRENLEPLDADEALAAIAAL
jgi:hypothetical protein